MVTKVIVLPRSLGKSLKSDDIGVIAENKEKYINFNASIIVMLLGFINKDVTNILKNIQLRFKDGGKFMVLILDKLTSSLCNTSGINYD